MLLMQYLRVLADFDRLWAIQVSLCLYFGLACIYLCVHDADHNFGPIVLEFRGYIQLSPEIRGFDVDQIRRHKRFKNVNFGFLTI